MPEAAPGEEISMPTIETLDVLPGEGEVKTVTSVRRREECGQCGEYAHYKHTYLLPNARSNRASKAYGRDDCSWSSDHEEFTCRECSKDGKREPQVDGYEWCSTFSATERFAHMFLNWREQK